MESGAAIATAPWFECNIQRYRLNRSVDVKSAIVHLAGDWCWRPPVSRSCVCCCTYQSWWAVGESLATASHT